LTAAKNSRKDIAQRLAQLKVLGRRESSNMPALRWQIVQAANKEETAIQNTQRFKNLATQASNQLQETVKAEKEDSAAIVREKAYAAAQHTQSQLLMQQADSTLSTTDALEKKIASLTPIVTDLQGAYLHEEHEKIQTGLIAQDQRREAARTKLQELPKSKAHTAELKALGAELTKAQAYLGKLYSDEQTDRNELRATVHKDELQSALYLRFKAKQALLDGDQAQLNQITTSANEEREQAQEDVNNGGAAEQRMLRTSSTNRLLAQSERRLRIKEKVYKKEVKEQSREASEMQARVHALQAQLVRAKRELKSRDDEGGRVRCEGCV